MVSCLSCSYFSKEETSLKCAKLKPIYSQTKKHNFSKNLTPTYVSYQNKVYICKRK